MLRGISSVHLLNYIHGEALPKRDLIFLGLASEGPGPSFSLPPQNCLRMVATQLIPKGHEIFNTYGQMANWQLIHMYGFAEPYPDNTDDTADIQMVTVREAALQGECLMIQSWTPVGMSVSPPQVLLNSSCPVFWRLGSRVRRNELLGLWRLLHYYYLQEQKLKRRGSYCMNAGISYANWRWLEKREPL